MMSKHTRGPWEVKTEECDKPYIRIRGTILGGRFKIANVLTPNHDGVHEREAEETRANARLIASAPELLEALIELLHAVNNDRHGLWKATDNAVSAIKQAKGESK